MTRSRFLAVAAATALTIGLLSLADPSRADSVTLAPVADTWVNANQPAQNNGISRRLVANGSPQKFGLVQFTVQLPAGATVTGATLTLTSPVVGPAVTLEVRSVSNSWSEATTFSTAPSPGAVVATATLGGTGTKAVFDVPVTGTGTVSFAITKATAGDTAVVSREGAAASAPALAVAFTTGAPPPPPPPTGDPFLPYGPNSLFQSRIPVDAPVSPDNAFFVSWERTAEPVDYWRLRVTSATNAQNYAEGQCSDPVFTIVSTGTTPSGQGFLKTSGFHANEGALATMAQSVDAPVLVRDFCGTADRPAGFSVSAANVLYDGTHILKSGGDGTITAGSFDWRTNGLDSRAPGSDAAARVNMVSRGRIPDSMVVTDAELRAGMNGAHNGTAGHSVEIFFVETNTAAGFQVPMVGAESGKLGCGDTAHPDLCAEGQYVRIDPTLPVPAGCTAAAAVVYRTLQQYGGYIGDNSGSGSGIKMQAGTSLVTTNSLQPCMHLDQLQILPKGYVPPHS